MQYPYILPLSRGSFRWVENTSDTKIYNCRSFFQSSTLTVSCSTFQFFMNIFQAAQWKYCSLAKLFRNNIICNNTINKGILNFKLSSHGHVTSYGKPLLFEEWGRLTKYYKRYAGHTFQSSYK